MYLVSKNCDITLTRRIRGLLKMVTNNNWYILNHTPNVLQADAMLLFMTQSAKSVL